MRTRQSGNGLLPRLMSEVKVAFRRFHFVRIIPRNQFTLVNDRAGRLSKAPGQR